MFAKQTFVQLGTNYVGLGSTNNPNYVREANSVRPMKKGLYVPHRSVRGVPQRSSLALIERWGACS